jgi:hypothetical protein
MKKNMSKFSSNSNSSNKNNNSYNDTVSSRYSVTTSSPQIRYYISFSIVTSCILLFQLSFTRTVVMSFTPLSLSSSTRKCQYQHQCQYQKVPSVLYSIAEDTNADTSQQTSTPNPDTDPHPYDQPLPNAIPDIKNLPSSTSRLEKEFYTMMTDFSYYTPKDIQSIPDSSYRALYNGVSAGSNEPLVMNAFAIIFNDLMPIRIAGRMIFKHLKNVMDSNIENRVQEEVRVQNETGLSIDAIDDGRRLFMSALQMVTDSGSGDEGTLTMTELIDSGIVETVVELMEYDSFDEFVSRMEQDEDEKINFEKFMVGLQKCALLKNSSGSGSGNENYIDDGNGEMVLCDISCDLEEVLSVTAQRMATVEAKKTMMTISERKKKHSDKYDEMVRTFEEWEKVVPSGDGRMIQVLDGCFAGAKNERIVQALKIVYMDYSALRVGGDLVYKLMGKLVNRRKNKN